MEMTKQQMRQAMSDAAHEVHMAMEELRQTAGLELMPRNEQRISARLIAAIAILQEMLGNL